MFKVTLSTLLIAVIGSSVGSLFIGLFVGSATEKIIFTKECSGYVFVYNNHLYKCDKVYIKQ